MLNKKYCILFKDFYNKVNIGDLIKYNPGAQSTLDSEYMLKTAISYIVKNKPNGNYFCEYESYYINNHEYRKIIFVTDNIKKYQMLF